MAKQDTYLTEKLKVEKDRARGILTSAQYEEAISKLKKGGTKKETDKEPEE